MTNARIIQREIDAPFRAASFALSVQEPVILIGTPASAFLTIIGNDKLSKHLHIDKIPDGMPISRAASSDRMGVMFHDEDVITLRVFYPPKPALRMRDIWMNAVVKILHDELGIDAIRSPHSDVTNDLVFASSLKKFAGCYHDFKKGVFTSVITLRFNAQKIPGLFDMSREYLKEPGDSADIGDIIGGLCDENPKASIDTIVSIAEEMAAQLAWTLGDGDFTKEELATIETAAANLPPVEIS